MSNFRNIFVVVFVFAMVFAVPSVKAGRIDITQALLEQPEIVQIIGTICRKICMGNERKSWLTQALVDISDGEYSIAELRIRLKHKHSSNTFGILYENYNTLKVKVRLNNKTCEASVLHEDIEFTNDLYQATWWLVRQLDKVFKKLLPSFKKQLPICS